MNLNYNLVDENDIILKISPAKFIFTPHNNVAKEISDKLYEIMLDKKGIGLSANQVGIGIQLFVMGYEENRRVVFNPLIIEKSEEEILMKEGCLSFPGLFFNVKRSLEIKVKYQNEYGEEKEETFTGLTARVFQHEYDHMQGILFTEKVSRMKLDMAYKKRVKTLKKLVLDVSKQAIDTAYKNVN